jgi:hypothetical protein
MMTHVKRIGLGLLLISSMVLFFFTLGNLAWLREDTLLVMLAAVITVFAYAIGSYVLLFMPRN